MTPREARDALAAIVMFNDLPDHRKKNLLDVIEVIKGLEDALELKHSSLITLARRSTTLSGENKLS